jgi:isopentenyldiphosphate isomerase
MSQQEQIWHVDENDNPIGAIGRDDSRRIGARYRMARVLVEDKDGNILLQKRAADKSTYPGCWDTSAGGNIAYGEAYEDAAKRELYEEVGIKDVELEEIAYFYSEVIDPSGKKMNRFTKLYRAIIPRDAKLIPQSGEVEMLAWVTRDEFHMTVARGEISDGLRQSYEHYYN